MMTKRRMHNTSFDNVRYSRLSNDRDFTDEQFELPPPKIPWKAICLSTVLFIGGFITLLTGCLIVTGHIDSQYSDRMYSLIVLGVLMFLPGAYHVRIAYCAFKRYPGYSFDDIPEYE